MKNPFTRLLSWWRFRKNYFKCSRCGYTWPKKGTKLSGYPSHPYGLHVHCPKCGKVVAQYIKESEVK